VVDFGSLPPEITSARIYAGPGSSSLQAAASSWNGIAAELNSAATNYEQVVNQLSSQWTGPSSAAAAGAAQQHVTWLAETAAQAEQAATQARAAAAAYEQVFASVVPPPVVVANRAETAAAVQANTFGQYTPLIAELEQQYGQFWAQDTSAMYTYASQSAAAAKVTPFAAPAATTSPGGTAAQAAAVTAANGTSAASSQTILQQLLSLLPSNIQALLTPSGFQSAFGSPSGIIETLYGFIFGTTVLPTSLAAFVNAYSPYASFFYNTEGLPYFSVGMGNFGVQIAKTTGTLGGIPAAAAAPPISGLGGLGAGLGGGVGGAVGHTTGVSASLGGAGSLSGKLAVPASWIGGAPPQVPTPGNPIPVSTVSAIGESGGSGNLMGGMPLAGAGAGGHGGAAGPKYGIKPTVMSRPPFAG
jgi:PPE-repeat protein